MSIISVVTSQTGEVGVLPSYASIATNDPEATVLTAGYLNQVVANGASFLMPCIAKVSTQETPTSVPQVGWYQVSHVGVNWSLVPAANSGDVVLPTTANYIAHFTNTTGTLSSAPANIINAGNIQAGLSGTAGTLISYSSTAARGAFIVGATANSGDTNTILTNAAMGQASTITIPDPANAAGRLLIGAGATPFVNGNIPQASGTGGLMADSGVAMANVVRNNTANQMITGGLFSLFKANGTEAANAVTAAGQAGIITTSALTTAGGGSYSITWTNSMINTTSGVILTLGGGTNTVKNITLQVTPGSGSATLVIYNNTAATALDGTLLINYVVL